MSAGFAPTPGPEDCQGGLHPKAIQGFELFNRGEYWLAHEALEAAWIEEKGQIRHLYRGILQVGVTYLHIQRRNYHGAMKVYLRSRRWLDPFPEVCRGIELRQLRLDLEHAIQELVRLGPRRMEEFDLSLLRPLHWRIVSSQ
jgi:predicted metal-dependent hydrolase